MSDLTDTIAVECDGLRDMLEAVARWRENDTAAHQDHRSGQQPRAAAPAPLLECAALRRACEPDQS